MTSSGSINPQESAQTMVRAMHAMTRQTPPATLTRSSSGRSSLQQSNQSGEVSHNPGGGPECAIQFDDIDKEPAVDQEKGSGACGGRRRSCESQG